ncbi:MAG: thiamine-phosphate kinase [Nitrospiria bacterium]
MPELIVSEWGERKLLKNIFKKFMRPIPGLKVGMGDDAAIVQPRLNRDLVYTTDTLIEKIDFDFNYTTYEQVGHKAMTANLSDIAAMGAFPKYYLLTLGIPSATTVSHVLNIIRGADRVAQRYSAGLIGGDLSESPVLIVSITLIGEIKPALPILRRSAVPDDILYVTGTLGDSKAGLEILKRSGMNKTDLGDKYLIRRHLAPDAKMKEGQLLSKNRLAHSMMDISDGFYTDILNLTEASGVGADIHLNELPLSSPLLKYGKSRNVNPVLIALSGGEDFELLFSVSPRNLKKLNQFILSKKINAKAVGKVTQKKGIRYLDKNGKVLKVKKSGFEHFAPHSYL